jgi:hypothetical protein
MGKPGAPKHSATDEAAELLAQGLSLRAVAAQLAKEGRHISVATLHRIRNGIQRRSESLINAGERRLSHGVHCPNCKVPIIIVPCRVCGASWPAELDQLDQAAERRRLAGTQQRPA